MFRRFTFKRLLCSCLFFLIGLLLWDQLAFCLFGWRRQLTEKETDSSYCPACYGESLCNKLGALFLEPFAQHVLKFGPSNYLRKAELAVASGKRQVILKRLATESEFLELDQTWCKRLESAGIRCKRRQSGDVAERLARSFGKDRSQLLAVASAKLSIAQCVSRRLWLSLVDAYDTDGDKELSSQETAVLMTTLAVNAEPVILTLFPADVGWPFPHYYGACGRVIVVEDCDVGLHTAFSWPWDRRVQVATSLMEAVEKFSNNSQHYIFHLLDLSVDNFALCNDSQVKLIDAENILVVDMDALPTHHPSPELITDSSCEDNDIDCQSFNEKELCAGGSRDFNYLYTCRNVLQGKVSWHQNDVGGKWSGLLHSPPKHIETDLSKLLQQCARQKSTTDRSPLFLELLNFLKRNRLHKET